MFRLMKNRDPKCQEAPEIPLDPPFSKGDKYNFWSPSNKGALLPLRKGGREGFLGKFSNRQIVIYYESLALIWTPEKIMRFKAADSPWRTVWIFRCQINFCFNFWMKLMIKLVVVNFKRDELAKSPSHGHPGGSRGPSRQGRDWINWIPAFAGMTNSVVIRLFAKSSSEKMKTVG